MSELKICSKCNIEKPITEFSKHVKYKSGIRNSCKTCESIIKKQWKKDNPDKVKEERKRWKKNNPDKVKEGRKRWKKDNPDKVKEERKRWKVKNTHENRPDNIICGGCNLVKPLSDFYQGQLRKCKECEKLRMKIYRETNPDARKETKRKWNSNNIEVVKKLKKEHVKRRKKRDPIFRAMNIMRNRTTKYAHRKFNEKRGIFVEIIGIDRDGFRDYISSKFKEGMSWENYGWSTWHLDHIIPLSSAKTIKELEELSHYTNLQPLWKDENLEKSNKLL
jgi:hypothetical protein